MPDDRPEIDIDFEGQMKLLASEAEAKVEPSPPPGTAPIGGGGSPGGSIGSGGFGITSRLVDRKDLSVLLEQFIRPLALELEKIKSDNHDQGMLITSLGKAINSQHTIPHTLESMLAEMRRLQSIESANQKLFDALHAELKSYKDGFLFDALQKPFIRDLVSLFDDLSEVQSQIQRRLETPDHSEPAPEGGEQKKNGRDPDDRAFLRTLAGNMENQVAHMIEVFLRMDVGLCRTCAGAPLDKKNHRTVAFEPASSPDEDSQVARSVKPGFFWRERTVRPEDVVVRRWTPPSADGSPDLPAPPPAPLSPVPVTPRVRPRHEEDHS